MAIPRRDPGDDYMTSPPILLWQRGVYPWRKPTAWERAAVAIPRLIDIVAGGPMRREQQERLGYAQRYAKELDTALHTGNGVVLVRVFDGVVRVSAGEGWQWSTYANPVVFPGALPSRKDGSGIIIKATPTLREGADPATEGGTWIDPSELGQGLVQLVPRDAARPFRDTYCRLATSDIGSSTDLSIGRRPRMRLMPCDEQGAVASGDIPLSLKSDFAVQLKGVAPTASENEPAWLESIGINPRAVATYSGLSQ